LDSSAVGIVHAAGESILRREGGDAALLKLLWDFLFFYSNHSPTVVELYRHGTVTDRQTDGG